MFFYEAIFTNNFDPIVTIVGDIYDTTINVFFFTVKPQIVSLYQLIR